MGSMYGGGLGSYGMGGLGGMGGMYGGMGGMGGMYGMGMGMGMEQSGALFNSMIALQSFGFLINSLSDIARSLDQNYEGLQLFKTSFKSNPIFIKVCLRKSRMVSKEVWSEQVKRLKMLHFLF